MARKVSFAFKNKLLKCDNDGNHLGKTDRLSELPDEVLISIISCLTLKEAAKTSILSRKWEKLWTFTTGILDFGCRKSLMGLTQLELEYERVKYTYWVNQILKLHQGHSLDEFRVFVYLGSISSCDINSWIEFAFLKGVKRLELNLRSRMRHFSNEKFTFPSIEKLTFFAEQRMGSSVTSCFHPLTAIILKDVNVAREVLEYLFLNCPFLERCSVMGSNILVHLKVFGPLLKLKYLELGVSYLHDVAEIDISAVNLVSFVYHGPKIILHVNNAPHLSELSLRGRRTFMEQTWQDISRISQLQSLSVNLSSDLTIYRSVVGEPPIQEELQESEVEAARKWRHESLKVVELRTFCGHRTYFELALSLLETAVYLEKIIIDTQRLDLQRHNLPYPCNHAESHERTQAARDSAMQLGEKLPAGATLVVL